MRAYVYDVTAMDDTCSKELVNLKAKKYTVDQRIRNSVISNSITKL